MLACDLFVASRTAVFGIPEVKRNQVAAAATCTLSVFLLAATSASAQNNLEFHKFTVEAVVFGTESVLADDIPVAHTPPGGYGSKPPPRILATCTEPLVPDAIDMRGTWRVVSLERSSGPRAEDVIGAVQRIEQCGDRVIVVSGGVIHDMRCDGTFENGVHDVSAINFDPIDMICTFESGVHVLRPVGAPPGVEITRQLDGDELSWSWVFFDARLRLLGSPDLAFEISRPAVDGEAIFQREAYICEGCTPEFWEGFAPPEGVTKDPIQVLVADGTIRAPSVLDPGRSETEVDLIAEVPDAEFRLASKPQQITPLGAGPGGPHLLAQVNRDSAYMWLADEVIHEMVSPTGERYILLSMELDLFESVDLETLDALADISVPDGWTYESHVAADDIIADSGGATTILVLELGRSKWEFHAVSSAQCVGDCDGNDAVAVNELIVGVNISLRRDLIDSCPAFDTDDSGNVEINELIEGVNANLRGCFGSTAASP